MREFGNQPAEGGMPHGRFNRRVSPASIAPTLAALLHVPPPGGCLEQALPELLPPDKTSQQRAANQVDPRGNKLHVGRLIIVWRSSTAYWLTSWSCCT